jgi:hypothetical protein
MVVKFGVRFSGRVHTSVLAVQTNYCQKSMLNLILADQFSSGLLSAASRHKVSLCCARIVQCINVAVFLSAG